MAPGPGPLVPATVKKELTQAKRREDELTVRLAAMEAELATLRGSHGNAQGQIAEISERLVVRPTAAFPSPTLVHLTPPNPCLCVAVCLIPAPTLFHIRRGESWYILSCKVPPWVTANYLFLVMKFYSFSCEARPLICGGVWRPVSVGAER